MYVCLSQREEAVPDQDQDQAAAAPVDQAMESMEIQRDVSAQSSFVRAPDVSSILGASRSMREQDSLLSDRPETSRR